MNKQDTQCLKGVAILFMLSFHVFSQAGHMSEMKYLLVDENTLNIFSMGCQLCVSIFVFISAYGTAATYRLKKINNAAAITKYTGIRYIKLMMEFWFVYIIVFLIAAYKHQITSVYGVGNWKYVWIDFMGMYMKYATPTLNSSWWFMSMAVNLIFILPVFILFVQKIGMITALVFGWAAFTVINLGLSDYFYVVILGVGLAQCDFLPKFVWGGVEKIHGWKKIMLDMFCIIGICCIPFFRDALIKQFVYSNPVHIFCLCILTSIFVRTNQIGKKLLLLLGRHATNMWLIHVLIYATWYTDLVFRWKYTVIILLVLIGLSLLGSIFIELLKRVLHYDQLCEWLCKKWELVVDRMGIKIGNEITSE